MVHHCVVATVQFVHVACGMQHILTAHPPPRCCHTLCNAGVCSTASYASGLCTASISMAADDMVMYTRTREMTPAGRAAMDACWRYGQEKLGWSVKGVDLMVPHQVREQTLECPC